eukprot:6748814-Prymnesium_polylepis.1
MSSATEVKPGFFEAKWMATLMQADVDASFRRQGYIITNAEEVSIGDVDFLLVEWASNVLAEVELPLELVTSFREQHATAAPPVPPSPRALPPPP